MPSQLKSNGRVLTAIALAAMLAACGSSDDDTSTTLGGTAAVGAPIAGGLVQVKCAGGAGLQTNTSTAGAWQVEINGQTLPCAVQVSGGKINGTDNTVPYHSVANTFGTLNVTPLTNLVVANLVQGDPTTWFNAPTFAQINTNNTNTALGKVAEGLGLKTQLANLDPLTATFKAENGDKLDDMLEALQKAAVAVSTDYNALLAAAKSSNFGPFSGFGQAFTVAYTDLTNSTGNGGQTSTCNSGTTTTQYSGNAGTFTNGQQVCFTASASSLQFNGKTLTNPVQNTIVQLPFTAYTFTDANGDKYEVTFNNNTLHEINFLANGVFAGQFAPTTPNSGTGTGNANLTVEVAANGITMPTVTVNGVPRPANQAEFCGAVQNDSTFSNIASSGGTLTINSCSFSGNVGNISATLSLTSPVTMSVPYSVKYTYSGT